MRRPPQKASEPGLPQGDCGRDDPGQDALVRRLDLLCQAAEGRVGGDYLTFLVAKPVERKEISGDTPCIGWLWGLLLVAAVVVIGVVVQAAVLSLRGGDPTWSAAVLVTGTVIAWTAFIAILRLGRRRARWRWPGCPVSLTDLERDVRSLGSEVLDLKMAV